MARIRFFGGKGGVGKTTVAAAYAAHQAGQNRVLLASTDPAHNLSDLFRRKIGPEITAIDDRLDAIEIDAEKEAHRYIEEVKSNLKEQVRPALLEEVHRHIDMARHSPGANESALFDRITRIILEDGSDYDLLVFDTAPTGHTLRLVSLPEMMGVWVDGLIGRRKSLKDDMPSWAKDSKEQTDPVLEKLNQRKARFSRVREILHDQSQTRFSFVAIPERLSVLETQRAVEDLLQNHIPIGELVINKVLKAANGEEFFRKRARAQQPYLKQLYVIKGIKKCIELPLLEFDIDDETRFREFLKVFAARFTE